MSLPAAYQRLRAALAPLGVEIGPDVLAIWLDRVRHGGEPLPEAALRDLATWAASLTARNALDHASTVTPVGGHIAGDGQTPA